MTLLRLNYKPTEYIVEFGPMPSNDLLQRMLTKAEDVEYYLVEHIFDPSMTYSGELLDEFKNLPPPAKKPLEILRDFMDILKQLGPWGAEQAALRFIVMLEKLKVTESFDRHYLLLCLTQTFMIQMSTMCNEEFEELSPQEKYENYSSPKVKRLVEIIRTFKPDGPKPVPQEAVQVIESSQVSQSPRQNKRNHRQKGPRKNYNQRIPQDDSLCSIIYVENRSTAKTLQQLIQVNINTTIYCYVSNFFV